MLDPSFESHYLKSILVFGSNLRVRASVAMRDAFMKAETIGEDRRLLFLSIRQQMCMALEDVGAHLHAFHQKQKGQDFLVALVRYDTKDAYLYNVFKDKTDSKIADRFGFGEVPRALQEEGYTAQMNTKAAEQFVKHFRELAEKQKATKSLCIHLKHGGLVYLPEAKDELRVLIRNDDKPEPFGIHYNPDALSMYLFITVMCSIQLKETILRYLAIHHPEVCKECFKAEAVAQDFERATTLLEFFQRNA